jgi:hypothetical protein
MTTPRDPRPLLCPACQSPLGVTTDDALYAGGVRLFRETMLGCVRCDNVKVWRPGGFRQPQAREGAAGG